jgi:hypothetical protein
MWLERKYMKNIYVDVQRNETGATIFVYSEDTQYVFRVDDLSMVENYADFINVANRDANIYVDARGLGRYIFDRLTEICPDNVKELKYKTIHLR